MNLFHERLAIRIVLVLVTTTITSPIGKAENSDTPAELLLFGFEADEVAKLPASIKAKVTVSTDVEGRSFRDLVIPSNRIMRHWSLYKGNATQGKYVAGLKLTRRPNVPMIRGIPQLRTAEFANRDTVMHYFDIFSDGRRLISTSGVHHLMMPTDWSDYDLLRMDVYARDLTLEFQLALEDAEILPPVVRRMHVAPNQWTTLEIDLRAAAKGRGLDLRKTTSMAIGVTKVVKGEPRFADEPRKRADLCFALLDNIRLSRRAAPAKHPVVKDDRPYKLLPGYYPTRSKPKPKTIIPGKPDRTPIKLGKPIVIDTGGRVDPVNRLNLVSAYDNNHLLVTFQTKTFWGSRSLQSLDGGKTWKGLAGKGDPTELKMKDFIDGGGRGEVIDQHGDVVIVTFGLSCGGPTKYHPRVFTNKLTFGGTGKGWKMREMRSLVDCEPRHCVATQSTFRSENGRLWLAYGMLSRMNRACIAVSYSDDDGAFWRPLREGFTGRIPGSHWPTVDTNADKPFTYSLYTKEDPDPRLVPFGKGLVCLWHNRRTRWGAHVDLEMARFDGKKWLPLQQVPYKLKATNEPTVPRLHAVSVNGDELFVLTTYADGLLHYKDGVWKQEFPQFPSGTSRLCLAGDTLMLIAAFPDQKQQVKRGRQILAPVVFRSWQRRSDGTWDGPRELATVDEPITIGGQYGWPAFRVPRFSPPNFVPLMWSTGNHQIKLLRVPVTQK